MADLAPMLAKIAPDAGFTVEDVPGKGIGVFATHDIPCGHRILAEKPLMQIDKVYYMQADAETAYKKLSDDDKKTFMTLASAHGQDPKNYGRRPDAIYVSSSDLSRSEEQCEARIATEKSVLSICMTNAMTHPGGASIFELASRFNHDCIPNASFAWNEKLGAETIHATRDIKKGEVHSITTSTHFNSDKKYRRSLSHTATYTATSPCESTT